MFFLKVKITPNNKETAPVLVTYKIRFVFQHKQSEGAAKTVGDLPHKKIHQDLSDQSKLVEYSGRVCEDGKKINVVFNGKVLEEVECYSGCVWMY